MSSQETERVPDAMSSPRTPQDIEAFFADMVLNDYDGFRLESVDHPIDKLDRVTDPNPARQEPLYAAAHDNAAATVGQLPPR